MTRYTDGTYLTANPTWHAQDSAWKLSHVKQGLRNARLPAVSSICEMGCGSGALLKQWAAQEPHLTFTGYEISPQAYQLCLKQAPKNVTFLQGEIPPRGPFDLALALDVIEHIERDEEWLEQVVFAADYWIFHVPLERSVYTWLRPDFIAEERNRMGHVHFYTPAAVEKLFRKHHLKIISWHYTNKYMERPPELKTYRSRLGMKIRQWLHRILPTRWAALVVGGYSALVVCRRES